MDKKDLVVAIAKKTGLTQHDTKKFIDAFTETVMNNVTLDNKVRIIGFGTFEVHIRKEHKGINPATKEEIMIPASYQPYFKPGQDFKNIVTDHIEKINTK